MRVVVDPNVIVSAAISPSGTTGRLLRLGFAGHFEIVASPMLLSEARETLLRPKFRRWLSEDMANELLTSVEGAADLVDDPSDVIAVVRDPGDDYLVALARMASADVIVSGDLDLLELPRSTVAVLAPRDLLNTLERHLGPS